MSFDLFGLFSNYFVDVVFLESSVGMFFWIVWRECLLRTFGKEGASVLPKDWQIKANKTTKIMQKRVGETSRCCQSFFFGNHLVWLSFELICKLVFDGTTVSCQLAFWWQKKGLVVFLKRINLLESTRTYIFDIFEININTIADCFQSSMFRAKSGKQSWKKR